MPTEYPLRVKLRRTQFEQISSELPLKADIAQHTGDVSKVPEERWLENPYYLSFCGEEFVQHRLVFDRSSLTRWRNRMGEERLQALIQESLSVATRTKAIKPSELSRVIDCFIWSNRNLHGTRCA